MRATSKPRQRGAKKAVIDTPPRPLAESIPESTPGSNTPGAFVTLKDVAALAGVSTTTASHVINSTRKVRIETRDRVNAAIEELGYSGHSLARSLRSGRTKTLGLVISDIENPLFFTVLASHIQRIAASYGYQLIFANSGEEKQREREIIDTMTAQRVDGIILVPVSVDTLHLLAKRRIPVVLVSRQYRGIDTLNVVVDDQYGAQLGFDHLWDLGHRDIVIVHGDMERSTTLARVNGVRRAYQKRKLKLDESRLVDAGLSGNDGEAKLIEVLKSRPRPTAIFSLSNWALLASIRAMHRTLIRCPENASLVGVGVNNPYWMPFASISIVEQPVLEMAEAAVRLLIDQLEQVPGLKSIVLRPSFTPGHSSAPVGGKPSKAQTLLAPLR